MSIVILQIIEMLPVDYGGAVALLTVVIVPPGPNFTLIGDGQTMKSADRDVDDLFTHQPCNANERTERE